MAAKLSKTQVDRLGDRLRTGHFTEADLRLLDEYRRSFERAYELVVRTIRQQLKLEPSGRPAKSTTSIIEKLRRESIRLSQVQDIAGCRLILPDRAEQNRVVSLLQGRFAGIVVDRRGSPSHGYRAVHVIAKPYKRMVEVQVRTVLQHLWADVSERFSDVHPGIKYGIGPSDRLEMLALFSERIANYEAAEVHPAFVEWAQHEKPKERAFLEEALGTMQKIATLERAIQEKKQ